ncbi:MAG: GNAT family N-acetyltransferase [Planctomycetales bacterium]
MAGFAALNLSQNLVLHQSREVQSFSCGEDPWSLWLTNYLRGTDILDGITRRKNTAWLFYDDKEELVAFGVVGTNHLVVAGSRRHTIGFIPAVAVHKNHQRQGVGRHVLAFLVEEAAAAGHDRVFLFVDPDNLAARKLYSDFGFRELPGEQKGNLRMLLDI